MRRRRREEFDEAERGFLEFWGISEESARFFRVIRRRECIFKAIIAALVLGIAVYAAVILIWK